MSTVPSMYVPSVPDSSNMTASHWTRFVAEFVAPLYSRSHASVVPTGRVNVRLTRADPVVGPCALLTMVYPGSAAALWCRTIARARPSACRLPVCATGVFTVPDTVYVFPAVRPPRIPKTSPSRDMNESVLAEFGASWADHEPDAA